ncbi:MAG: FkbM family methyltransferase [bacterium]|nr:FkbM family methyltransferase [bacterium]
MLRRLYRTYIHSPRIDRGVYALLDALTSAYALSRGYSFPKNYIRRWKLDMLRELYEKETIALFRRTITPGMVVVDIGAHIGYYARIASVLAGRNGKVQAFEADPENFALLEKNTRRFKNIERHKIAVSDKTGTIDFYHYDDKSGAHSTLPNVPLQFEKRKLSVPATDLDSYLRKSVSGRVDVIKMDIEGGESAALRGMPQTLRDVRFLFTEFAPAWIEAAGSSPLAFLQSIEGYGFAIFAVTENGLVKLSPVQGKEVMSLLPKPKSDSHASEFINLYCVKQ